MSEVLNIQVIKGNGTVAINPAEVHGDVWSHVVVAGLKVVINGGASKVTATTYPDEAERQAEAMRIAQERVTKMLDGTLKIASPKGTKTTNEPAAVMTEARRLAKNLVKEMIKEAKEKISQYSASDITQAANKLIEQHPELISQAKENLAAQRTPKIKATLSIAPDEKKIKAAKEKAAKAKATKAAVAAKAAPKATVPVHHTAQ